MLGVTFQGGCFGVTNALQVSPINISGWASFSNIVWLFIWLLGTYKEEADIAAISPRKNS